MPVVLLDKGGWTAAWQAPTYRAHIPARPTEAEYQALVEEFMSSVAARTSSPAPDASGTILHGPDPAHPLRAPRHAPLTSRQP